MEAMRLSELMGGNTTSGSSELKISNFKELKDLKAQHTMTGLSPVSGVLTAASSSSSSVVMPPLWNNLLDLSGLKPSTDAGDLIGVGVHHGGDSSQSAGGGGANSSNSTILNNSTASSSISNINSNTSNNNEDSYEAGIADDMRELALRLESELELDENGV